MKRDGRGDTLIHEVERLFSAWKTSQTPLKGAMSFGNSMVSSHDTKTGMKNRDPNLEIFKKRKGCDHFRKRHWLI